MALALLQGPPGGGRLVPGARRLHPGHETQEHLAPPARRRADYAFGVGVLRLTAWSNRVGCEARSTRASGVPTFSPRLTPWATIFRPSGSMSVPRRPRPPASRAGAAPRASGWSAADSLSTAVSARESHPGATPVAGRTGSPAPPRA